MVLNLLIGMGTMVACLLLQAYLLVLAIRYYAQHEQWLASSKFGSSLIVLITVMLLLVIGNLVQIAMWAWVFILIEEFDTFNSAFYHSSVNFATLGYGDIVMSERHRLLGPLESVNGVIMIGVSTAALTWAIQDVIKRSAVVLNPSTHQ